MTSLVKYGYGDQETFGGIRPPWEIDQLEEFRDDKFNEIYDELQHLLTKHGFKTVWDKLETTDALTAAIKAEVEIEIKKLDEY